MTRVYLDWNATAPLRPEARAAMLAALDQVGNPSSVHAEGRAAKAIVERARAQVIAATGAQGYDVVFTSGATEAAALVLAAGWQAVAATPVEHDCIAAWAGRVADWRELSLDSGGAIAPEAAETAGAGALVAVQAANSETGILQPFEAAAAAAAAAGARVLVDLVQYFGRLPVALSWLPPAFYMLSAHKFGGPKGVGALLVPQGWDLPPLVPGGGQEMGRRSGTENVAGIAGMGAAAEAAAADLAAGAWDRVAELRNILENAIEAAGKETIFVGRAAARLPNTACFATPGWKGETQVMALDLAGFAVSAGSACSSGKVRESRVLRALGQDAAAAAAAIRVSLGPATTEEDVLRFAEAWTEKRKRRASRAA